MSGFIETRRFLREAQNMRKRPSGRLKNSALFAKCTSVHAVHIIF